MQTGNNFKKTSTSFFDKKDFLKIGGAVLITLLAVYLFNIFLNIQPQPIIDNRISTIEMYGYYNQYTDAERIPILYDLNGVPTPGKLEGFPMTTYDLEQIIHKNNYRDPKGKKIDPDSILFYLGQDGTSNDNTGQKYNNIRMIAVGIKSGKLLVPISQVDMNNKLKSSIYDKAMPCPGRGCPTKPPPPPPIIPPSPTGN